MQGARQQLFYECRKTDFLFYLSTHISSHSFQNFVHLIDFPLLGADNAVCQPPYFGIFDVSIPARHDG